MLMFVPLPLLLHPLTIPGPNMHARNVRLPSPPTKYPTNPPSLDTAGTEQFTAMREIYMRTGHGFLLVYSITSLSTFLELTDLRDQILRIKETTKVPLVIVGNKSDLAEDRAVLHNRAIQLSRSWGRVPFYETSARRRLNVDEVFMDLCRQIMRAEMEGGKLVEPAGAGPAAREGKERVRERERRKKKAFCVVL